MIIELKIQHYLTSPNIKKIIKSRKIAYLGAKFFLAPCFFMLTYVISWEQRELRTAATFSKGSGYSKNDLKENGTPIILYGRLYTKYETVISEVDTFVDVQPNSVYSTGHEVIVPASGETAEDISRASFVAKSGILLGGDLNIIVPDDYINPVFLALTISNGNQQKELSKRAQGKSVVHIHNSDLENVVLLYPKYEEQEKIGEYFSKLDSLITLHQREYFPFSFDCESAKTAQKTISWEQRKVGDVLSESRNAGHSGDIAKKLTVKLWGKGVYAKDDKGSAATQYFTRHAGQFIYSKLDFLNSAFGVVPQELESYESTADLPAFDCVGVEPYFVFYRAIQPSFYLTNGMIADGSRKAKRIHVETFLDMPLDLPSIEEQRKIGAYLDKIDNLITLHQRKLETLQKMKKSLLQKMFV